MNPNLVKIGDIVNIYNSYITLLAKLDKGSDNFAIVFHDPTQKRIIQLFDSRFSLIFREIVSDFSLGMTTGSIVGLARKRTPEDIWYSDTIERNYSDKNSLHQGIRRIIEKEDGLPVFVNSVKIIGNIAPALSYTLKGTPTEIQQILHKHNRIQKYIINEISKGKPQFNQAERNALHSIGDGYKSDNRLNSIRSRLDALTLSPEMI